MLRIDLSSTPLAVGRTAEVYAIDDERVVKLLKPGFDPSMLDGEAAKTTGALEAGLAVPAVLGRVEIAGRCGLILERVDARSMLDAAFEDPANALDLGQLLGDLHARILNTSVADLPNVKDWLADQIDHTDLPLTQRTAAKDALVGLSDGTQTLHNDFHPGNVLITSDGPRTIDWNNAVSGPAAADVCRTVLLMTPAAATEVTEVTSEIEALVIQFAGAYRRRCLPATGVTEADLAAWRLPVIAARLAETIAGEHDLLMAEINQLTG